MAADRILTTHTGSLPRPDDLIQVMWAKGDGIPIDERALEERVATAVQEIVEKQVEAGIDVINDGEMSKPSYATYVKDRLGGFGGESPESYFFADLADYPRSQEIVAANPGRRKRSAPACNAPITVVDKEAAALDMVHLSQSASRAGVDRTFSSAASPGVVSLFFDNAYYETDEEYVFAIAEAMRPRIRSDCGRRRLRAAGLPRSGHGAAHCPGLGVRQRTSAFGPLREVSIAKCLCCSSNLQSTAMVHCERLATSLSLAMTRAMSRG